MAQVDFSNAILEPSPVSGATPLTHSDYLRIFYSAGIWNAVNGAAIVTNNNYAKLINTSNKVTIIYTGTFTASGTEFYIGFSSSSLKIWRVSNISFNSGDTYSFAIDIETTITA